MRKKSKQNVEKYIRDKYNVYYAETKEGCAGTLMALQ